MTTYTSRQTYEHVSQEKNDPIVEWKTCSVSGQPFPLYQSDVDFYNRISPTFAGKKFLIPAPLLCPEERARRRLSFRNERNLYRRTCDASGKDIVSIYSPDKPFKVYDQKIRWSDQRDAMSYGRTYDFTKTFTQNFSELMKEVPRLSLFSQRSENAEYTNQAYENKNMYMGFGVEDVERGMYCSYVTHSSHVVDCTYTHHTEQSYNVVNCDECYNIHNSFFLKSCRDCWSCVNCIGCANCIQCSNLTNASYCFQNKTYSKEEYESLIASLDLPNLTLPDITKFDTNVKTSNSYGHFLYNTKDCTFCHDVFDVDHCKYFDRGFTASRCYDGYGMKGEYSCEGVGVENLNYSFANTVVSDGSFMFYSDLCFWCSDCFGCVGLRNKQYCILNKQYSKAEYETLVAQVIEKMQESWEWWEFLSPSLSPFGYNESIVQQFFPLEEDERWHSLGYKWSDFSSDPKIPDNAECISPSNYSDQEWRSLLYDENISSKIFMCEVSGRPFILQKYEIEFYKKHRLPLPKKHPDVRHSERMHIRQNGMGDL